MCVNGMSAALLTSVALVRKKNACLIKKQKPPNNFCRSKNNLYEQQLRHPVRVVTIKTVFICINFQTQSVRVKRVLPRSQLKVSGFSETVLHRRFYLA